MFYNCKLCNNYLLLDKQFTDCKYYKCLLCPEYILSVYVNGIKYKDYEYVEFIVIKNICAQFDTNTISIFNGSPYDETGYGSCIKEIYSIDNAICLDTTMAIKWVNKLSSLIVFQ